MAISTAAAANSRTERCAGTGTGAASGPDQETMEQRIRRLQEAQGRKKTEGEPEARTRAAAAKEGHNRGRLETVVGGQLLYESAKHNPP